MSKQIAPITLNVLMNTPSQVYAVMSLFNPNEDGDLEIGLRLNEETPHDHHFSIQDPDKVFNPDHRFSLDAFTRIDVSHQLMFQYGDNIDLSINIDGYSTIVSIAAFIEGHLSSKVSAHDACGVKN